MVLNLAGLAVVGVAGVIHAAEWPRWIEPDDATGSAGAVIVSDQPLVHTTQVFPSDDEQDLADDSPTLQVARLLERLDARLIEADSGLEQVVKLNVYVARTELVLEVKRSLAQRFAGARKPAVSYVVTSLPMAAAVVAADAVATTSRDPGRAVQRIIFDRDGETGCVSAAIIPAGSRIYISGQAERDESLAAATRNTLTSLRATLKFLERSDADIVQLKAFLTPMADARVVAGEVKAFFSESRLPPLVMVQWQSAASLPIEIEAVVWGGQNREGPVVEYLTPPAMKASPVFSRVARVNHTASIYVGGLLATPADPTTFDPQDAANGHREVSEVFAKLERILQQSGSDLRHLVKATYYVSADAASTKLNELRPNYYDPARPPAASKAVVESVGHAGLGLSMDMIAVPAMSSERPE
jgi:enamine deaminase RidA (YjgF/YER057c/UK114 family)